MARKADRGREAELRAVKALLADGYTIHRCLKTVVWTRFGPRTLGQDVFGCVDVVAKRAGEPTRWIQVTCGSGVGKKFADLAAVPWTDAHDSVEVWRWVGGRARKDGRTGRLRPRQYFQVYRRINGFALDKADRVHTVPGAGGSRLDARGPQGLPSLPPSGGTVQ